MSATIDSVTTEDAAPTTAPHKISAVSGKSTATVLFTPDRTITAWQIREGGTSVTTGTLRKSGGQLVCGEFKCGAGKTLSSFSSSAQRSAVIDYSELAAGADGARTLNVWIKSADAAYD